MTVKVYKGSKAEGTVVASAEAIVLLGKWGPASSSPALTSGTYTAVAEEASSLGNPTGKSEPRTFVVNTEPPEVTLAAVPTPSNDTSPSFSGTASESLPVTVKVYKGSKVEGSPVATAEGTVASKKWGPVSSLTLLTSGTYTAVAEEASSLGNPTGKSETRTFVINTSPPEVTLQAVPTPSNNTKPSFSGTAGESLPVTVKVYKGATATGSPVATAEGPVKTGKWGAVSSSTPLTSGTYTAVAEEESSLGNANGKSEPRTFVVNTEPPVVTLEAVPTPSNDTTPVVQRDRQRIAARDRQGLQRHRSERHARGHGGSHAVGRQMGSCELLTRAQKRDLHGGGGRGQLAGERDRQQRTAHVRGQHRTAGSEPADDQSPLQGHQTDVPRDK